MAHHITSLAFHWHPSPKLTAGQAETFDFQPHNGRPATRWSVSQAKEILASVPHEVRELEIADLRDWLAIGIVEIDWQRIFSAPEQFDLALPLIAVQLEDGTHLLIDGWHRVALALSTGLPHLWCVVLSAAESRTVQLEVD